MRRHTLFSAEACTCRARPRRRMWSASRWWAPSCGEIKSHLAPDTIQAARDTGVGFAARMDDAVAVPINFTTAEGRRNARSHSLRLTSTKPSGDAPVCPPQPRARSSRRGEGREVRAVPRSSEACAVRWSPSDFPSPALQRVPPTVPRERSGVGGEGGRRVEVFLKKRLPVSARTLRETSPIASTSTKRCAEHQILNPRQNRAYWCQGQVMARHENFVSSSDNEPFARKERRRAMPQGGALRLAESEWKFLRVPL